MCAFLSCPESVEHGFVTRPLLRLLISDRDTRSDRRRDRRAAGARTISVIRNGRIVDGTGSAWYRGDVAVRGDTIARIAPAIDEPAARVIDAAGQVVSPGFIDIHTHARRGLSEVPTAPNYIRQGVTTVMEGPDGSSPVPLAPFLAELEALKKSINIGAFIGQGSVRSAVIGNVDRKATADEIAKMEALVDQGMKDGAMGLSTGLFYVPGTFTPTEEVIQLARVAGRYGGMHESHQRDEASKVLDSVKETIRDRRRGRPRRRTSVTRRRSAPPNWGRSVDMLRLVDEARARGVDVTLDQYPYTASATSVSAALLPSWVLEGSRADQLARLRDPASRARIKTAIALLIQNERGGGDPKNVQFSSCGFDPSLAGKTLADLTRQRGLDVTVDNAAEATIWLVEQGGCSGIFHAMSEEDLERILQSPGDDDRVGRRGADLRSRESASAQLRDVRARARRLRSREARPDARGCRPQDDVAARERVCA